MQETRGQPHIKFYAQTTYVIIETGEVITKKQFEAGHYRITLKEKHYEFTEKNGVKFGIIIHTRGLREHEQQRIEF